MQQISVIMWEALFIFISIYTAAWRDLESTIGAWIDLSTTSDQGTIEERSRRWSRNSKCYVKPTPNYYVISKLKHWNTRLGYGHEKEKKRTSPVIFFLAATWILQHLQSVYRESFRNVNFGANAKGTGTKGNHLKPPLAPIYVRISPHLLKWQRGS